MTIIEIISYTIISAVMLYTIYKNETNIGGK